MCSDDGKEIVPLQELARRLIPARPAQRNTVKTDANKEEIESSREEVRATSNMIMNEALRRLLLPEVLRGVGPQDVAHQPCGRRLSEAVDLRIHAN